MQQRLEQIESPCFAMRFGDSDAWVESRPCVSEEERTALIAKWAARAVQCGKVITGMRLFIKRSYTNRVVTVEDKKESKGE